MRVKGSVAVITGASSGIGRATALRLARAGADVVLVARRADALESLAEECRGHGVRALAAPTDVSDAAAVNEVAQRTVNHFGRLDVWVNNAALSLFGPFLSTPLEDFRRVLDVNIMGYVHGARGALTHMRPRGTGVLVNVSSVVAEVAQPYTPAYSMSKAAVRSLSVSLRSELMLDGKTGIKVVTVLPATIDTPFFAHAANYTGREVVPMPPVYSVQRTARAVVNAVRRPRREVPVGTAARQMMMQHRMAPGTTEAMMGVLVDKSHLSRTRPAAATGGNLHRPSAAEADAEVAGGWGGRRRTAQRRLLTVGALVGGGVLARRLLRDPAGG